MSGPAGGAVRLGRRRVLGLLAGSALGAVAGLAACSDDDQTPSAGGDGSGGGGVAALVRIGERYRREVPGEDSVEAIVAALDLAEADAAGDPAGQLRRLRDRIRRDFEGDVVTLDGWVLARTEARLCALVSLTA